MRRISLTPQNARSAGRDEAAPTERAAFSISEFCRLIGICRSRAYLEIREGRLRVVKSGRRTLIRAEEIAAFLDRLEDNPSRTPNSPHHALSTE